MDALIHTGPREITTRHHQRRRSDDDPRTPLLLRRWHPNPTEQALRIGPGVSRVEPLSTAAAASSISLRVHQCDRVECAAQRVLATTELLEQILSYQTTHDVLELRRVARMWQQTVDESPYLRRHRFIRAQWRRHPSTFILLAMSAPGISIGLSGTSEAEQRVVVILTPETAAKIAPGYKTSRRRRSLSMFSAMRELRQRESDMGSQDGPRQPMSSSTTFITECDGLGPGTLFITQPPLTVMQAFVVPLNENIDEEIWSRPLARLSCDVGMRLWSLAETAQMLFEQHRTEPSSPQRVVFRGALPGREPDLTPRKRSGVLNVVRLFGTS